MKPICQSKNFSVCLKGWTIPKYAIYGSVYGMLYVCLNATAKNGGYNILVWHNATEKKPARWVQDNTKNGYGAIYCRIRDFVKSAEYIAENVIFCHAHNRDEIRERAERAERVHRKNLARERHQWERDNMFDAPKMKQAQGEYIYRCKPQGGSLENEYTSCMDLDKIGYVGAEAVTGKIDFNKSYFEQGQNTSGTAGAYTRSGFETRDGMKTRFADYHGQKTERPIISDPYSVCKDEETGKYYRTCYGRRIEED